MFLLDTHAFLWFLCDDPKLSAHAKTIIESEQGVFISIASFWEMAIKDSLGKLKLPASIPDLISGCERSGFAVLPIKAEHLALLKELPKLHGDPFDRLLICQAAAENMTLISADENIAKYAVPVLWNP